MPTTTSLNLAASQHASALLHQRLLADKQDAVNALTRKYCPTAATACPVNSLPPPNLRITILRDACVRLQSATAAATNKDDTRAAAITADAETLITLVDQLRQALQTKEQLMRAMLPPALAAISDADDVPSLHLDIASTSSQGVAGVLYTNSLTPDATASLRDNTRWWQARADLLEAQERAMTDVHGAIRDLRQP
ncbi:hypothetical protein RI367_001277 [Sorochytrium milnesiophthora]